MSKIICEVCGTSYSDTATNCPICGSAHLADVEIFPDDSEQTAMPNSYQYVKGGRFSKSNVRKRNSNKDFTEDLETEEEEEPIKENSGNRGLIITIVILVLAILAVAVYIFVTFFMPVLQPDSNDASEPSATAEPATIPQTIPCTEISLDNLTLTFSGSGASRNLIATVIPINTTDVLSFESSDESVATVDQNGLITAIGYGEAKIVVKCGAASAECMVFVNEESPELTLNREEITFYTSGEEWLVYDGPVPLSDITWASSDPTVATVEAGKIIAVAPGETTIYANYSGYTVSCMVTCDFEESTEPPETTEAPTIAHNYKAPFRIKNLFSPYNDNVWIYKGSSFTLVLVDANGDQIEGVIWSVEDESCCKVENGVVTGISAGKTTVVATFNGEKFTCRVEVR